MLMHHRSTTAQIQALFPFAAGETLGSNGAYIGTDLLGRPFHYDPIGFYGRDDIGLTDPNMVVLGQIGKGKSALVKCLCRRLSVFGYASFYMDPKGETAPLARAFGVQPVRPEPGGDLCLNPFDSRFGQTSSAEHDLLLQAALEAVLERPLSMQERRTVTEVVNARGDDSDGAGTCLRDFASRLRDQPEASDVALAMWHLVNGPTAGLFDGPTSTGIDLGAALVALDLSSLLASLSAERLRTVVLALAAGVLVAALRMRTGRRLFVLDEAWFLLRDMSTARWLQQQWKLARSIGVANIAVLHRLSDLDAVAASREIARGLVADTQTKVVFAQPAAEARLLSEWLGLTDNEISCILGLPRGWALWKVGRRTFVVALDVQEAEWGLIDTDQALIRDGAGTRSDPRKSGGDPERPVKLHAEGV